MRSIWSIAATACFLALAGVATPVAADEVNAIATGGKGDLTMCKSMVLYSNCNLYHHIKLPPQIAVGDKVRVHYGSNPKRFDFPVGRIVREGDLCTVLSDPAGDTEKVNKIEVASCQDAPSPK
jgi:hypothetical protein